jgi:F-type H+-transporting ATPase subunit epsilon
MPKLSVQVVTAEREVLAETDVDMVVAPGSEGEMGILPRHAALLTTLRPGVLRLTKGGEEQVLAVGGGFLQVANNRVLVLADVAERNDEIDARRAEEARQQALRDIEEARRGGSSLAAESARYALRRSMARLQASQRRRRRPGE